jgi:hypothetical protein
MQGFKGSSKKDSNDQRITEGMFSESLATRALPLAASRFFKFIMWGGIDPWNPMHSDLFGVEQETPRYFMLR